MTEEQIREIARTAVHETLATLGVDTEDPFEVQRDLAWVREARIGSQNIKKWTLRTVVGAAVTGGLFLLWKGIEALRL